MRKLIVLFISIISLAGCANRDNEDRNRTVMISTYFEDEFLDESVKLFNQLHPDTPLELNIYKPVNEEDGTNEMYASYISTALMSGKADDIIVLSSLPYYNYYDMLTDFTPYFENTADFSIDDFYQPLFDSLKVDGKLFILPLNYSMDVLAFNKDYAGYFDIENGISFETCNAVGKELIDENGGSDSLALYNQDGFQMFFWKLQNNYNRFINLTEKECNIDSNEFVNMLEEYKSLENEHYIPRASDFWEGNIPDKILARYDNISNIDLVLGFEEPFMDTTIVTGDNGEVYYDSYLTLGINAASYNKETAWEFIRFLLSEDRQSSLQLSALPVNKKALAESTRRKIDTLSQLREEEGKPIYSDTDTLAQTYIDKIEKWTGLVRYYSYFEPTITDMIFLEGQHFFLENKSAKEVAQAIDNKVKLYLNE